MIYIDKQKLLTEYKKLTLDESISYTDIAKKLDLSPQAFNKLLGKKNLCFDDIKKMLAPLGYDLHYSFVKQSEDEQV